MGRPRKAAGVPAGDVLMMEAFWAQLASDGYSAITATSIVRAVGFNRATFYYYFASVEDLAWCAVEQTLPNNMIGLIQGFLAGHVKSLQLDEATRRSVARLCLLTGDRGAAVLVELFKDALERMWVEHFDVDASREDVRAILTFMVSGVSGILGDWAGKPIDARFDAYLQTIGQVFSAPVMRFVEDRRVIMKYGLFRSIALKSQCSRLSGQAGGVGCVGGGARRCQALPVVV
ncbi:TetR/AcrR family transcriptional regulator [Trueperella pyogenes]|uniref:TetR/AcrR family transcriptional regulator n=1 Tax=Trueperella pyogenes TaxID=1661 RepID=UPI0032431516